MSNDTTWPTCTAHYRACGHALSHESPGEATEYAREHADEMVNRNGYAICACHPSGEAEALGVVAFDCEASA